MLSFHGLGASATNQHSTDGFVTRSDRGNFIVVYPQAGGAAWAKRDGCAGAPVQTQYKSTVEQLAYKGCRAPVTRYRVHHNGHTWPGHPLGLDHQALVDYFSGKNTGKPYPLMVALGLTPEDFADTISLANTDIDASDMILAFFRQHSLNDAP